MARIRTIKPDFFLHEEMAALPPITRLLFIGLWTQADREGRLADRPARLKAQLFPYEKADVDALLSELRSAGFVVRYMVGAVRFLQVVNFTKHQLPHYKEIASVIPAPLATINVESTSADVEPRSADVDSSSHAGREGKGREQEGKGTEESFALSPAPRGAVALDDGFEAFWRSYGKRTHKAEARKAWRRLKPPTALQEAILTALAWQFRQPKWLEDSCQFAPNPATYLNDRRWEDEQVAALPHLSSLELENRETIRRVMERSRQEREGSS